MADQEVSEISNISEVQKKPKKQCRVICFTHGKRCTRQFTCKGELCRQHYRLYGKKGQLFKFEGSLS